ncbi:DNA topoisomerase I [Gammaproteobacteria bacterium 50_400_T64]|nr:DNA topoisomerase I [Gammaproteobacteria bacterium 50_400_T64]
MGKSLVIVESPAKAKTINKYLGNDFIVKSSVGHVRDLPTGASNRKPADPKERAKQAAITRKLSPAKKVIHKQKKAKQQLINRMGINPDKDWAADYQILPGKEKVVSELVKLAKNADTIYLATDLDREGEAIAWHLQQTIGGDDSRYKRVVFNEITKKAIQEAFAKPGKLDTNQVNAQQARRFLDRVVGFMVSPLLWAKVARGLSAGRVQSVAVKLVVEREREIQAFVPEEYWTLHADLEKKTEEQVRFEVRSHNGKAYRPVGEAGSVAAVTALQNAEFLVTSRDDKPTQTKPPKPFITSTLQQAASTRLGFGVKKTMMMAQRLYEAGYITYMRTDSTNLSKDAVENCRELIATRYGKDYLPEQPNVYSSKAGAQEAHEAVRPSNVDIGVADIQGVDEDAVRLYEMIWQQFVACQMVPAKFTSTSVGVTAGEYGLQVRGRVVRFEGFLRAIPVLRNKDDTELPEYTVGEILKMLVLVPRQHFTKPPARFSEAALVRELEKRGIGRPSTYAAIISTIQDRGYVRLETKRFYAEKIGDIVTSRLSDNFSDLMDYGFTATLEEQLDEIADGTLDWKDVLNRFYAGFSDKLEKAQAEEGGMAPNGATETDIPCPKCERPMMIRTGSTGVFLGCSGYDLPPKERCKETLNLVAGDEAINADEDEEAESKRLLSKHHCDICATQMDSYLIDETRKLHICGKNPDCPGYEVEAGTYRIKGYEGPLIECDKCGADMQLKSGRFGKYFGCTADECKNTRKLLRSGQAAPPKMDPVPMPELACVKVDDTYILRDGAAGLFLAASQFPKNRETRAPLVKELLPHKDEIDPKYTFLFSAPTEDPDGNKTVIRFARKTQEIYVQSEIEGKASGWKVFFQNEKWVVTDKRKK